MSDTATLLGTLAVEGSPIHGGEHEGAELPVGTIYRPVGTPLRNDGVMRHWMLRGEAYRLEHDGVGWHVTNDLLGRRHVYRLVEALDMQYISQLPLDSGELTLEPGTVYEIREQAPGQAWGVYAL